MKFEIEIQINLNVFQFEEEMRLDYQPREEVSLETLLSIYVFTCFTINQRRVTRTSVKVIVVVFGHQVIIRTCAKGTYIYQHS